MKKTTELKTFNVEQECDNGDNGMCNGEQKSLGIKHPVSGYYIHQCSVCKSMELFEKEYPHLEYEFVEEPVKAQIVDPFDDDIPF